MDLSKDDLLGDILEDLHSEVRRDVCYQIRSETNDFYLFVIPLQGLGDVVRIPYHDSWGHFYDT